MADVGFGEILVLAHEDDNGVPEFFGFVLFKAIFDDLCFANVSEGLSGLVVGPEKEVNPGTVELIALEQHFEVSPWSRESLAGPI
ncbi:MAG: hypothetical protein K9N62_02550 [Verrucomicrobia bacterium]|nr:hypothetical protein [Verrucomicrobiota bacterium]